MPVSDCENSFVDALLYLSQGVGFLANVFSEDLVNSRERGVPAKRSDVERRTNGRFVGPVAQSIEQPLFVGALHYDISQLADFAKTGSDRLFIVSDRFKNVIEKFDCDKSEFIPVSVSLTSPGQCGPDADRKGAGTVEGAYWLWHPYNWLDVIIEEESERWPVDAYEKPAQAQPLPRRLVAREDLPGSPMQEIASWGPPSTPRRRLSLRPIDYDANPFFFIVGIEGAPFVSPALVEKLQKDDILNREHKVRIFTTPLDTLSPFLPENKGRKSGSHRIYQTGIIVPDGPAPYNLVPMNIA